MTKSEHHNSEGDELDLYTLLEFVYNSGYNLAYGFKPTEKLSDLLYRRKMIILDWHDKLFTAEINRRLQSVRDALPEKYHYSRSQRPDADEYHNKEADGFNKCIDQVTALLDAALKDNQTDKMISK